MEVPDEQDFTAGSLSNCAEGLRAVAVTLVVSNPSLRSGWDACFVRGLQIRGNCRQWLRVLSSVPELSEYFTIFPFSFLI